MAGNSKRAIVRLESTAGTGYRYTVTKNKSKHPDKLEYKKFDPVARKHVLFKEIKQHIGEQLNWQSIGLQNRGLRVQFLPHLRKRIRMFEKIKDFLNQVYLEMNKVSWPSYNELRGSTYLIIIFFLLFVLFLFGIDWMIQRFMRVLI